MRITPLVSSMLYALLPGLERGDVRVRRVRAVDGAEDRVQAAAWPRNRCCNLGGRDRPGRRTRRGRRRRTCRWCRGSGRTGSRGPAVAVERDRAEHAGRVPRVDHALLAARDWPGGQRQGDRKPIGPDEMADPTRTATAPCPGRRRRTSRSRCCLQLKSDCVNLITVPFHLKRNTVRVTRKSDRPGRGPSVREIPVGTMILLASSASSAATMAERTEMRPEASSPVSTSKATVSSVVLTGGVETTARSSSRSSRGMIPASRRDQASRSHQQDPEGTVNR